MSQGRAAIPYRADVDGLRAVAVLPVVLYHAGFGCPGGFVGVDVFFVISGFLIGSLVVAEIRAGVFRMADFWERRVRRILPALLVVVLATYAVSAFLMVPQQFKDFGKSVLAQPLLLANVVFWRQTGYFDTSAELQPLLHTWSLAVEEQFYLLFPLVMMAAMKAGLRFARFCVVAFLVLSLAWCLHATHRYPSAAFYLIFSRLWELDLGVLLALLPARPVRPRLDSALSWLGLAMILGAVFGFSVNTPFPGAAALAPCLGAALLIRSNTAARTGAGRLLGAAPLVRIGKISYSLYLWHWPAIVFTKLWLLDGNFALPLAGAVAASFALAALSYRFVETPFRAKRLLPDRRGLFAAAAVAGALLAGLGAATYRSGGFPGRMPEEVRLHERERSPYVSAQGISQLRESGSLPLFGHPADAPDPPAGELLLWGDSHAVSLLPLFDELGAAHRVSVHAAAQPEIGPFVGAYTPRRRRYAPDDAERVLDYALQHGIRHVVLAARWSIYGLGAPDGDRRWLLGDGETTDPRQAEAVFERGLRRTVERLDEAGVRVWLFREVIQHPREVPETVAQSALRGRDLNTAAIPAEAVWERRRPIDALIDRGLAGLPVGYLEPLPFLIDESGRYLLAHGGRALFSDRHHLSAWGTRRIEGLVVPVFEAAAGD